MRDSFPHPYTEADAQVFIAFMQAKPPVSEALEIFVAYIFGHTEIRRLFAPVFIHNKASARVLEKAGFRRMRELGEKN